MKINEIRKRIKNISNISGDDEAAHSLEDRLRHDVLKAIADGAENAKELAIEALKTSEINFARWCE